MKAGLKQKPGGPPPNETQENPPGEPAARAGLFWQKTLEAGEREEHGGVLRRIKGMFIDYHLGAAKGWVRGGAGSLGEFFDPRSDLYDSDYDALLQDIRRLPEKALDHGMAYMDSDWEHRGAMNAEMAVQAGMWFLRLYLGLGSLAKGLLKGVKKF